MSETHLTRLQTPKEEFTIDYPVAVEFMNRQIQTWWPWDEPQVEKDIQDIRVNLTDAERHGVTTVLKLFTIYEQKINAGWENIAAMFPRPADIQSMCGIFAAMEINHAHFYSAINTELGLATDEFYSSYLDDPEMKDRVRMMVENFKQDDPLLILGTFAPFEMVVLFSSFMFLKHFQLSSKNKILNIVSGINFSVKDEENHGLACAWLFRTLMAEQLEAGIIDQAHCDRVHAKIVETMQYVYEHECILIEKIFEHGPIESIDSEMIKGFIRHRVNFTLKALGYEPIYDESYNPLAKPFYDSISGYSSTDFFSSQGSQYIRGWSEEGFKMGKGKKKVTDTETGTGAQ